MQDRIALLQGSFLEEALLILFLDSRCYGKLNMHSSLSTSHLFALLLNVLLVQLQNNQKPVFFRRRLLRCTCPQGSHEELLGKAGLGKPG